MLQQACFPLAWSLRNSEESFLKDCHLLLCLDCSTLVMPRDGLLQHVPQKEWTGMLMAAPLAIDRIGRVEASCRAWSLSRLGWRRRMELMLLFHKHTYSECSECFVNLTWPNLTRREPDAALQSMGCRANGLGTSPSPQAMWPWNSQFSSLHIGFLISKNWIKSNAIS